MSFITAICIVALSVASVIASIRITQLETKVRKLERGKDWYYQHDD